MFGAIALLVSPLHFTYVKQVRIFVSMENKQTYSLQELADYYETTTRTIFTWILPIREELLAMTPGKKRLRILLPKQVKLIKEFLG
ncbi:MAG: hypothetical protein PHE33_06510 [Bacteroidales bacterium]|nr:hypothetical protein [Bacteroidales bacterium]